MHKSLAFLVVAFNISIQTKTFLYKNSLNYYHLKFGLTQASLIRIQFCFLQILAATELLTQLILVVGGMGRGGGFSCSKYLEPEHDTRCNNLYQESGHMFTYFNRNELTDILIASGKPFI